MAKFPAVPASVDRYVRDFLNRLAGRSGKTYFGSSDSRWWAVYNTGQVKR